MTPATVIDGLDLAGRDVAEAGYDELADLNFVLSQSRLGPFRKAGSGFRRMPGDWSQGSTGCPVIGLRSTLTASFDLNKG
jgi:hypothetical protein